MPQKNTAIVGCAAGGLEICHSVKRTAHRLGYDVLASQAPEELWARDSLRLPFCAIVEAELMFHARETGTEFGEVPLPCIAIVRRGDVSSAIRAFRIGAAHVLEDPLDEEELYLNLQVARRLQRTVRERRDELFRRQRRLDSLTSREKRVLDFLVAGKRNKEIAKLLLIGLRTVEAERARIMKKAGVESLATLAEFVLMTRNRSVENPWQVFGGPLFSGPAGGHGVDVISDN